ncbi:MAG: protein kinase, partial [Chloroflexota bacterium]
MPEALLNNRYKVLAQIGAGGMSLVYKAQDMSLGRVVAIKVLRESYTRDTEFLNRFLQEARAAANLAHPNIVTVHDFGEDSGRYYIVMEFIEGQTLKQIVRDEAPLNLERTIEYATQLCAGVGYAHRAGLVHCDLKPQNIMITPEGRVKVTDFGIARALISIHPQESNEIVWGSPQYFSPEQATGNAPTPASDVYSIGIMLYEMLSGRLPFQSETPTLLALMHVRDEVPSLSLYNPAIPDAIERIIKKVLSKEPALRYRNADQLGHILHSYGERGTDMTMGRVAVAVTPSSTPQPVRPSPSATTPTRPSVSHRTQPAPTVIKHIEEEEVYGEEEEDEGIDWLAIVLGAVALVSVLGLIPLWLFVLIQYNPALLR